MRVLYLTSGTIDYQQCIVFHGLVELLGIKNVIEYPRLPFMYQHESKPRHWIAGYLYSLYNLIPDEYCDVRESARKSSEHDIKSKVYDLVIYGDCQHALPYHDLVQQYYPTNKIVYIDGEDHKQIRGDLSGHYFKRELISQPTQFLHPISFGIPACNIVTDKFVHAPTKWRSDIVPGQNSTYTYTSQQDYYHEYQSSWVATTISKSGFDAMRHLEIMACGCIADFVNIQDCPKFTMTQYPKQLLTTITTFIRDNNITSTNYHENIDVLKKFRHDLLVHLRENLTTRAIAENIIYTINYEVTV